MSEALIASLSSSVMLEEERETFVEAVKQMTKKIESVAFLIKIS